MQVKVKVKVMVKVTLRLPVSSLLIPTWPATPPAAVTVAADSLTGPAVGCAHGSGWRLAWNVQDVQVKVKVKVT